MGSSEACAVHSPEPLVQVGYGRLAEDLPKQARQLVRLQHPCDVGVLGQGIRSLYEGHASNPAALSQHDKVKQEAAETGFGLKYHTALASILEPIPSVYVAVETAVALARVLGEKDASSPQKQGKPGWADAYDRVWKVILDGIPGGPCIEVNADNLEAMFDNQHSNKPRRRWF